jgi:hypothetical protein
MFKRRGILLISISLALALGRRVGCQKLAAGSPDRCSDAHD